MFLMRAGLIGLALVAGVAAAATPAALLPPALAATGGKVTLEAGGRPLSEVIEDLTDQVDLPLTVGKELAEEKVTVYFRALAAPEALQTLAASVDAEWQEKPNARTGRKAFRLEPSERRKTRLLSYRRARLAAEKERDNRALSTLVDNLANGKPWASAAKRPDGRPVDLPLWARPVRMYGIVRDLPAEALRLLILNANESFTVGGMSGFDSTPVLTLPARSLSREQATTLKTFLGDLAAESATKGEGGARRSQELHTVLADPSKFLLDFWSVRYDQPGYSTVRVLLRLNAPGNRWLQDLPLAEESVPVVAEAPADPRSLAPRSATLVDEAREAAVLGLKSVPIRSDRALIEIARAARINLAADSYTRANIVRLSERRQPLKAVLRQAEEGWGLVYFWVGSSLVLRSRDWARACDREPTAAVTDQLDRRLEKEKYLRVEDYITAAASLNDRRLASLINHQDEDGKRVLQRDMPTITRYRHVLRGYATLSAQQRRQIATRSGLPIRSLAPEQRQRWGPALRRFSLFPAASLAAASLKTTVSEASNQMTLDPLPDFLLVGLPEIPEVELAGGGS